MGGTKPLPSYDQLSRVSKAGLLLLGALVGAVGCTRSQAPAQAQQSATARANVENDVFICPDGDIKKTGANDHKVTLTWEPSASSSPSKVRYCLYRTEDRRIEKSSGRLPINKAPCNACTRVNETAVPESRYIDTQVTNGAHYCYVAIAMEISNDVFSGFSNEVEADIPADPKPVAPQVSQGICRNAMACT